MKTVLSRAFIIVTSVVQQNRFAFSHQNSPINAVVVLNDKSFVKNKELIQKTT